MGVAATGPAHATMPTHAPPKATANVVAAAVVASLGRRPAVMDGRDGLKPVTAQKSGPSSRMVAKFLELKCRRHIEAINHRDFFEDSILSLDKTSGWEADIGLLASHPLTSIQYADAWRIIARRYPDYTIHCDGIAAELDDVSGTAEVRATLEITGMPSGILLRTDAVSSFQLVEGKWLATRFTTKAERCEMQT